MEQVFIVLFDRCRLSCALCPYYFQFLSLPSHGDLHGGTSSFQLYENQANTTGTTKYHPQSRVGGLEAKVCNAGCYSCFDYVFEQLDVCSYSIRIYVPIPTRSDLITQNSVFLHFDHVIRVLIGGKFKCYEQHNVLCMISVEKKASFWQLLWIGAHI